MKPPIPHAPPAHRRISRWTLCQSALAGALLFCSVDAARAADHGDAADHGKKPVAAAMGKVAAEPGAHGTTGKATDKASTERASGKTAPAVAAKATSDGSLASRLKEAMTDPKFAKGDLVINAASLAPAKASGTGHAIKVAALSPAHGVESAGHVVAAPTGHSRAVLRAKAAALVGHEAPGTAHGSGHDAHWAYEGENGPQAWAKLKPEFNVCAIGKRQSPIHIEDTAALPGPAEPLQLAYRASSGSVVNNGHTIQVDLEGDNTLNVRGTTYRLVQFHFHHPAEEKVNHKGFSMVAHLVHKSDDGRLAVVAVLMDPGTANPLVEKVWTHMPLDTADRVRLPAGLIDINELLPKDQRYYQFIGSLTTPPCTEGVLWLVLKQPMTLARDQLRLFAQQFPNNARPVQALNGRTVREAQ